MPDFSKKSYNNLVTCHSNIQAVMKKAIEIIDFSVLCGYRDEVEQNRLEEAGKSQVRYPNSKHNIYPSMAIDIAPYPIDWKDITRFKNLANLIKQIALMEGVAIEWGGDWKNFKDYPHYQIRA